MVAYDSVKHILYSSEAKETPWLSKVVSLMTQVLLPHIPSPSMYPPHFAAIYWRFELFLHVLTTAI
jgi:hypothetical protein